MNFQFQLEGHPIEEREALALFAATNLKASKPFPIALEKILDTSKINSNELFKLAVEKEIPDLASLAFKVSVAQRSASPVEALRRAPKARQVISPKKIPHNHEEAVEDLIAELNARAAYWTVGAVTIMNAIKTNEWCTLREIAVSTARRLDEKGMHKDSILYKGFTRVNGELEPLDLTKDIERKDTFHVSPIYIGLREGLIWCTKKNLVEQRSHMSVSDPNKKTNYGNVSRMFYKLRATKKGLAFADLWADMENYIELFYRHRCV